MRLDKSEKAKNHRIEAAYRRTCTGVQINLMDIPNVFDVAERAINKGASDAELDAAIATYVATIRRNNPS